MRKNQLKPLARLALFVVSYIPLFAIMAFTQIYNYREYLNWGGLNKDAVVNFIIYFGATAFIIAISIFGAFGLFLLLKNLDDRCRSSGRSVTVTEIENKNSDSISYLFTYLIPFVFQDLSSLTNVVSIFILLTVTLLIYMKSSMMLINPTISLLYTIYQIEYKDLESGNNNIGMIITKQHYLKKGDDLDIEQVGQNLYYAIHNRD